MLSVVICAYNEEKNLAVAVSSVKALADEIVVVDTSSTDATTAVAEKLRCTVYHHPYPGIVEPVRNFAISKARGDWILLLDADEEIPPSLAAEISRRVTSDTAYFRLPRKNIIFGQWIKSDHWWPDYVYRLFRKGAVTWDPAIHSVPFTKGVGQDLPVRENLAIIHHHYSSVSQYVDRLNRYTDFQAKDLLAAGYSFAWTDLLVRPVDEFITQFFSRGGYRDGLHGLALSLLQAFSHLVLYLKLWQKRGFVAQPIPLTRLPPLFRPKSKELAWWYYTSLMTASPWPQKLWWRLQRKISSL